jgi:amino acid transporter
VAQAIGGSGWAKAMALSIALSAIASTGAGIVVTARIVMDMAHRRVLPPTLGLISRRFSTPAIASIVVGLLVVILTWVYLLATSVEDAFDDVVAITGLLFSVFYILTALATIVYYRRRVFGGVWDFLILGLLPLGAAGFLAWILVKTLQSASAPQVWSLVGIVALGLIMMLSARFVLRSGFFDIRRESDPARQ